MLPKPAGRSVILAFAREKDVLPAVMLARNENGAADRAGRHTITMGEDALCVKRQGGRTRAGHG